MDAKLKKMRGGVTVEPGAKRRGSEWAEKEVLDDRDDASPRTAEHRRLTDAMHLNKVCEKMKMFFGSTRVYCEYSSLCLLSLLFVSLFSETTVNVQTQNEV